MLLLAMLGLVCGEELQLQSEASAPYNASRRLAGDRKKCPLSGVVFNLPVTELPVGWATYFERPYSHTTNWNDVMHGQGDCILWGAMRRGESELSIAAFGDREAVESTTINGTMENGVYWYAQRGLALGFAGDSDVRLNPGDDGFFDCGRRLSWLLNGHGGYRAGCTSDLGTSASWYKVVMYGPEANECKASDCRHGLILKSTDLPSYCLGTSCSSMECCQRAKTCTVQDCPLGYLPKHAADLPDFCTSLFCLESECCNRAPRCSAQDCTDGYILKEVLPRYGCLRYNCTKSECCIEAPVCPADMCDGNASIALRSTAPAPNCTSRICSLGDCCKELGACYDSICPEGYGISASETTYCADKNCTILECCFLKPPQYGVTGLAFQDQDLDAQEVGGLISWMPPLREELVSHFEVYLGLGRSVGNVSVGTNTLALPQDTAWQKDIIVYVANAAGRQRPEARKLKVVDLDFTPRHVSFYDQDIDKGDLEGAVNWSASFGSTMQSLEASVCSAGKSLRAETGNASAGNSSGGPGFQIGEEWYDLPDSGGGIGIAVLEVGSLDLIEQHFYHPANSSADAADLRELLRFLPEERVVMMVAWGAAMVASIQVEMNRLGVQQGEAKHIVGEDKYALISRPGATSGMKEMLVKASSSLHAVAECTCPLVRYDVYLAPAAGNSDVASVLVGSAPFGTTGMRVPVDTPIGEFRRIQVFAASAEAPQTQPATILLVDTIVGVSNLKFTADQKSSQEWISGILSWDPPDNKTLVSAYRVYVARRARGMDKSSVEDFPIGIVPVGINEVYVECTGNYTHIRLFIVSPLGEQSEPTETTFDDYTFSGAPIAGAVAIVVATSAISRLALASEVTQQAKSAVTKQGDFESLERCAAKLQVERIKPTSVLGTYMDSHGVVVKVDAPGCPRFRSFLNPLFPSYMHHHHWKIRVREKKAGITECMHRLASCENTWDNDTMLLRKLANNKICVQGLNGKNLVLKRKLPFFLRRLESHSFRVMLRIYAPLMAMLVVAAIILSLQELAVGLMLMGMTLFSFFIVCVASRSSIVQDLKDVIIRWGAVACGKKFWTVLAFVVGLLPCIPAFMSLTIIGLITGVLLVISAGLSAKGVHGGAFILEFFGGGILATASLYGRFHASSANTATTYLATFVAAALTGVRAIDDFMSSENALLDETPVPADSAVSLAEESSVATGVGFCNALALEAFLAGDAGEHIRKRLLATMRDVTGRLLHRCRRTLWSVRDELLGPTSKWLTYPESLASAVADATNAAGADFGLQQLSQLKELESSDQAESTKKVAANIFMRKTVPRLEALEKAMKHLMSGPLAMNVILRGAQSVRALRVAVNDLGRELVCLQRLLGTDRGIEHHLQVQMLSLHADRMAKVVKGASREIADSGLDTMGVSMMATRFRGLEDETAQTLSLLGAMHESQDEQGTDALRDGSCRAREKFRGLVAGLVASNWDPKRLSVQEVVDGLASVLEDVLALQAFCRDASGRMQPLGVLDAILLEKAQDEVLERMGQGSKPTDQDYVRQVAETFSIARRVVSVAATIHDEMMTVVERTDAAFESLKAAREEGTKATRLVSKARERMPKCNLAELRNVRDEALEFSTGQLMRALAGFQDLSSEPFKQLVHFLSEDLRQLQELLKMKHGDLATAATQDLSGNGAAKLAWGTQAEPKGKPAQLKRLSTQPCTSADAGSAGSDSWLNRRHSTKDVGGMRQSIRDAARVRKTQHNSRNSSYVFPDAAPP